MTSPLSSMLFAAAKNLANRTDPLDAAQKAALVDWLMASAIDDDYANDFAATLLSKVDFDALD